MSNKTIQTMFFPALFSLYESFFSLFIFCDCNLTLSWEKEEELETYLRKKLNVKVSNYEKSEC